MEAAQSKPTQNLRILLGIPAATKGVGKTNCAQTNVL